MNGGEVRACASLGYRGTPGRLIGTDRCSVLGGEPGAGRHPCSPACAHGAVDSRDSGRGEGGGGSAVPSAAERTPGQASREGRRGRAVEEAERARRGAGLGLTPGSPGGSGHYGYHFLETEVSSWGLTTPTRCLLARPAWETGLKVGGSKGKFVLEKNLQFCGVEWGGKRNRGEAEKQEMRAKEQIGARKSQLLHLCGSVAFAEHLRPSLSNLNKAMSVTVVWSYLLESGGLITGYKTGGNVPLPPRNGQSSISEAWSLSPLWDTIMLRGPFSLILANGEVLKNKTNQSNRPLRH
eukprot:XP_017171831.1 PREDICTED: uncharacterized protein Gm41231 [Mus musculus]